MRRHNGFHIYSTNYKNIRQTFKAARTFYLQQVPTTILKLDSRKRPIGKKVIHMANTTENRIYS